MATRTEVIESPYQVICEGQDDCDLFSRLLRDLAIPNFQIGCGRGVDGRCLGKDGFGKRLDAIINTAVNPVRGYVIMADADDNPADRFKKACGHLRDNKLPVPAKSWEVAEANGVRTAVLLIPSADREGGLESLLLDCCDTVTTFGDCISGFCDCVMHDENPPRRKIDADKLRLRALIAANNPDDPSGSISYWLAEDKRPFAMTHDALEPIARFLREIQF